MPAERSSPAGLDGRHDFELGQVQMADMFAAIAPEQIVATFSEMDLMHAAIRSGQGLGISNVKLVEADEELIQCFESIDDLTAPHLILISQDAYRRQEVKLFVKYFAPRYAAIFK